MAKFDVLGTRVDAISWSEAIEALCRLGGARTGAIVCICNVHMVITARFDTELSNALRTAKLVTPDGAPIALAIRRGGAIAQPRIDGPELMWRYLRRAEQEGQVVSLFGGSGDTLAKLTDRIKASYPLLTLGCAISPPYRRLTKAESESYIEEINAAGTNVLFVSLGCPKQEKWMLEHVGSLNCAMVGVGAAFDYHAGLLRRAPEWMRDNSLEWMYRLLQEPRRLWRRYLSTNIIYIILMLRSGFRAHESI